MKVTITPSTITIVVDRITPPRASSSGKTLLVASETAKAETVVDGKKVTCSVNCHIPA